MRRDEAEVVELYGARYAVPRQDANRAVERAVIGGDWGANSYTTMAEADELARLLGLGPGVRLLDLGAGRGWPGLYLSAQTGCSVVLADLPYDGLRQARARAAGEGLSRAAEVVASAADLPLRPGSVDAIVSTDVLC